MSRFATPNKSRATTLAKSPGVPIQREPGYRYGRGQSLPGPSIKGRHMNEVVIDYVRKLSPSTTTRMHGPTSNMVRDSNVFIEESDFLPLSSTKPFEKPEKEDRSLRRKEPTPITSVRPITPTRTTIPIGTGTSATGTGPGSTSGGSGTNSIAVNANFISVNRSVSPSGLATLGSSSNSVSGALGLPLSSSASVRSLSSSGTMRSSSAHSLYRAAGLIPPKERDRGYGGSSGSVAPGGGLVAGGEGSVVSAMSKRSLTPTRLTKTYSGSSVSGYSASMFQSLAEAPVSSPAGLHNLQLTQSAFKSVRKALVRNQLSEFLEHDEDDMLMNRALHGRTNSAGRSRTPNGGTYDSGNVAESVDSPLNGVVDELLDFDENDYQPSTAFGATLISANGTGGGTDAQSTGSPHRLTAARKRELKKHHKIVKMTGILREAIMEEINMHKNTVPEDLFFASEHTAGQSLVYTTRRELLSLIRDWQRTYLKEGVGSLDRYFIAYQDTKKRRNDVLHAYYEAKKERERVLQERERLKCDMMAFIERGTNSKEKGGLGLDFRSLLAKFPQEWFIVDDELMREREGTNEQMLNNSAFFSPSASGKGGTAGEGPATEGDGDEGERFEDYEPWKQDVYPHSHTVIEDGTPVEQHGSGGIPPQGGGYIVPRPELYSSFGVSPPTRGGPTPGQYSGYRGSGFSPPVNYAAIRALRGEVSNTSVPSSNVSVGGGSLTGTIGSMSVSMSAGMSGRYTPAEGEGSQGPVRVRSHSRASQSTLGEGDDIDDPLLALPPPPNSNSQYVNNNVVQF